MSSPIEYQIKTGSTMTLDGFHYKVRSVFKGVKNAVVLFLDEIPAKKPNTKPFKGVFPKSEHRFL